MFTHPLRRWRLSRVLILTGCACAAVYSFPGAALAEGPTIVGGEGKLAVTLDASTGLPAQILAPADLNWLGGPIRLEVIAEATKKAASPGTAKMEKKDAALIGQAALAGLGLTVSQKWTSSPHGLMWEMDFTGPAPRAEHRVTIQLPVLNPAMKVFTPSDRGVMNVDAHPSYGPVAYGSVGWGDGKAWVLPLVSVLAPDGRALTVACPPTDNIPNLSFAWKDARTLELTLAHRGMGGGKPSPLRLLFYAHSADYRSALAAYAGQFPEYFRSPLPRTTAEGTFYYHHIQDHPDPAEMARQHVRYIWSSFWFTYLGEYLPDEKQWPPYTYAKWWKLGQMMSDDKINAFIAKMRARGIATYAYFNVTEYGGLGGKGGDAAAAARALKERFANALVKNPAGQDIPTWEGAMAMNPGPKYALWPFLMDQVRRHLARLPDLAGFIIDRLDWASTIDYGHDDGLTMINGKPAENMALPVAAAVREVCRLAHEKDKRVFVNQFYRIEPLRDTDGTCHENDYLPALGYLTPLRPAAAWHHRKPYSGDLLQFEAQLKRRLHWKLFPQMIAHQFPISQQAPNAKAADLLEIYAPLFEPLLGCEQVLRAGCVAVSGPNNVNLFRDVAGRYVAAVTSRTNFLARGGGLPAGPTTLTIRGVEGADKLAWAQVYSAEGPPETLNIRVQSGLRPRPDCGLRIADRGSSNEDGGAPRSVPGPVAGRRLASSHNAPHVTDRDSSKDSPGARRPCAMSAPDAPGGAGAAPAAPAPGQVTVTLPHHATASVVVLGSGAAPALADKDAARLGELRVKLFGPPAPVPAAAPAPKPDLARLTETTLRIAGENVGSVGPVAVLLAGRNVGTFTGSAGSLALAPLAGDDLRITLQGGDEGVWLVPKRAEIVARNADGQTVRVARWTAGMSVAGQAGQITLAMQWAHLEGVAAASVKFVSRDATTAGQWVGKYGALAAWIPAVQTAPQNGYRLDVLAGQAFTWTGGQKDPRSLAAPGGKALPAATCWHDAQKLSFLITPPDAAGQKPYRLSVYAMDFDRNKRSMSLGLGEPAQGEQKVTIDQTGKGVYLTWTLCGEAQLDVHKLEGFNAVVSGIFIDPAK